MNIQQIREIQALTLLDGGTPFSYFKDRYALLLLAWAVGNEGMTIAEIKKTAYAKLLNKPRLKAISAKYGDGWVTAERLLEQWPSYDEYDTYYLTLSDWGTKRKDWQGDQVSRPGGNLVLQLNFTAEHDNVFYALTDERIVYQFHGHPVSKTRNTLAWARIDLDLATGEGLIEEIQSDWIRDAANEAKWAKRTQAGEPSSHQKKWARYHKAAIHYYDHVLKSAVKTWSEAMLSAALWYLRDEVGLNTIYYHNFEWGNRLKHVKWGLPPKSLYTKLPRSFGFQETGEVPEFLLKKTTHRPTRKLLRDEPVRFYKLNV